MYLEIAFLGTAEWTVMARIWFLSSVSSKMNFEIAALCAAKWTARTDVRLLSRMSSQMDCIVSILGRGVATVGTLVYLVG